MACLGAGGHRIAIPVGGGNGEMEGCKRTAHRDKPSACWRCVVGGVSLS